MWHCKRQFHCCQLWHPPKGWKIVFSPWIFFLQDHLYVDNILKKFQVQKNYPKKDIGNLPKCAIVRLIFYIRVILKIILITTHDGRLSISFVGKVFWNWNLSHILSHRDNLVKKNSWWKIKFSAFGRASKLAVVILFFITTHDGIFLISFFKKIFWTWNLSHMLPT